MSKQNDVIQRNDISRPTFESYAKHIFSVPTLKPFQSNTQRTIEHELLNVLGSHHFEFARREYFKQIYFTNKNFQFGQEREMWKVEHCQSVIFSPFLVKIQLSIRIVRQIKSSQLNVCKHL